MKFKKDRFARIFSEKNRLLSWEGRIQKVMAVIQFISVLAGILLFVQAKELHPQFLLIALVSLLGLNFLLALVTIRFRAHWMELEKQFSSDEVTGILNRLYFEKTLEGEVRRAGRYHYPLTLCFIDLDGFKSYNEQFGARRGDELLCRFARFLRGNIRFTDCVARYENDQFCILLPHTDLIRGQNLLARLLVLSEERMECTFSAGLTAFQPPETQAQFVMRAGLALDQAKKEGKKQIRSIAGSHDSPAVIRF